ncbi:MAG: hypothetical protein ABSE81_04200 [Candidatus Omnitrophota bacterium]
MKESENKSRAMEIADMHMNEYLTQSYESLVAGATNPVTDANGFTWTATVTDQTMSPVAPKVNIIPYKEIEVICSYNEQNANGLTVTKYVRLLNMVPYPYMHLFSEAYSPSAEAKCYGNPGSCIVNAGQVYNNFASASVVIEYSPFSTQVRSDLLIFYNISIDITDSTGIGASDLIFSKCFIIPTNPVGPAQAYNIQTGTPVLTQPTISNTVSVQDLPKGEYTLEVIWFKDHDAGTIMAKRTNVIIFQVEK